MFMFDIVYIMYTQYNVCTARLLVYVVLLATTVMFTEAMYSVDEDDMSVTIGVELSNPSSTDTVVEVYHTDRTATGEYCSILINYKYYTV